MITESKPQIEGNVASGFERIKTRFETQMHALKEEHAQLCIYVGEEQVVDLWASSAGEAFTPDSLVNVFSSGKSLEVIAIASLIDKQLLSYNSTIASYWPEFAQAGKANLTVADLMRHEAGLAAFNHTIDPKDLHRDNIKQNKIGAMIEAHPQEYADSSFSTREYHALTRGWIANELFRRVDPNGRTIGEYLKEDLAPLGVDCHIGVDDAQLGNVVSVSPIDVRDHFKETFKPRHRRQVKDNFFQLAAKFVPLLPRMSKQARLKKPAPLLGMSDVRIFNEAIVRQGETPSANAHCSARGLAKLAAVMANGGSAFGSELFSEETWQAIHDVPVTKPMGFPSTFTQGGVAAFGNSGTSMSRMEAALNIGREGFYGWMGLGGSVFQWHPEKKIGFAFVPTQLHILDLVNERAKVFQSEVLRCV